MYTEERKGIPDLTTLCFETTGGRKLERRKGRRKRNLLLLLLLLLMKEFFCFSDSEVGQDINSNSTDQGAKTLFSTAAISLRTKETVFGSSVVISKTTGTKNMHANSI